MASPDYAHARLSSSGVQRRWIDCANRLSPTTSFRSARDAVPSPQQEGRGHATLQVQIPIAATPVAGHLSAAGSVPHGMLGDVLFGVPSPHVQGHCTAINASPGGSGPVLPDAGMYTPKLEQRSLLVDDLDHIEARPQQGASKWQMVFNVLNLYVGLGLLSQGYSFAKGGWVTAVVLSVCALLFSWTGKLIVRCFASVPESDFAERGGHSYPNLGYAAFQRAALGKKDGGDAARIKAESWGRFGRGLVVVLSVCEFVGAACMSMIIYWQCAMPLVRVDPQTGARSDRILISAVLTALLLPSVSVRSFSDLSIISFFGFITSILILGSVIAIFAAEHIETSGWRERHSGDPWDYGQTEIVKLETLPMALGIILLTFSAHACLPSFKKAMANPERDFEPMLNVSFVFILLINLSLAVFGYLVFGEGSRTLITTNIREAVSHHTVWQNSFALVVQGFVAFKSYCTVVPCVAICVEMLQEFFGWELSPCGLRAVRCVVTGAMGLLSFLTQDYLGAVEALIGGVCSMCTSMIFPVFFYYLLNRHAVDAEGEPVMSKCRRAVYLAVTLLSLLAMCGVVASSIRDVATGGADESALPPEN